MAATTSYLVFLGGDLQTAEQIQKIAGLDSPPLLRPVDRNDDEDEEQDAEDMRDDEDVDADEAEKVEKNTDQDAAPKNCCLISTTTKDALIKWSLSEPKHILKRIIPIVLTSSACTDLALKTYPVPYLFYGTLSNPEFLAEKLGLSTIPTLREATIKGWKLKIWGTYRAAVEVEDGVVEGMVFDVQNEGQLERLAAWEGGSYEVKTCDIGYEDGGTTEGCVFAFCGDMEQLQEMDETVVETLQSS